MFKEMSLHDYLSTAASGSPTPGGGSVSALAGALGTTMACMVANFTIGKKKFKHVEAKAQEILRECEHDWERLLQLVDDDATAYSKVSEAYGMTKTSTEQKKARTIAIQDALKGAMEVPHMAVRRCLRVLERLETLADIGNPNLISDVGVAAILLEAALRGAEMNVEVNLAYLTDKELIRQCRNEMKDATEKARDICKKVCKKVFETIHKRG